MPGKNKLETANSGFREMLRDAQQDKIKLI